MAEEDLSGLLSDFFRSIGKSEDASIRLGERLAREYLRRKDIEGLVYLSQGLEVPEQVRSFAQQMLINLRRLDQPSRKGQSLLPIVLPSGRRRTASFESEGPPSSQRMDPPEQEGAAERTDGAHGVESGRYFLGSAVVEPDHTQAVRAMKPRRLRLKKKSTYPPPRKPNRR